ncbi:MAG: hypothetical protein K5739_02880 [Lachnospiraceae bacterium]|nr:hypothetical protein [Lachnospiraceae bacterium]
MKREVFNTIVMENINSTLVSVTLSGGIRISQELLIEGNRTSKTDVSFIKIEDTYVGIRQRTEVTYDYTGQTRKGDSRHADYYMGYDEIVALEFYDKSATAVSDSKETASNEEHASRHGIVSKPLSDLSQQAKSKERLLAEAGNLFIPTAGDI